MADRKVYLILYNIRSAENVGAMFRTADAAGVDIIYLTGYTPAPLDRFKRPNTKIVKAALGAEKTIPWETNPDISVILKELKKKKVQIIALEQDAQSVDYKEIQPKGDIAIVVGNEVTGIEPEVLKLCDCIAEIPMKGEKESLNVSVALGIALFRMLGI